VEKPPIQVINCLAFGLPNIQVCDTDTVVLTGCTISSSDLRHRECNKNQQSTIMSRIITQEIQTHRILRNWPKHMIWIL